MRDLGSLPPDVRCFAEGDPNLLHYQWNDPMFAPLHPNVVRYADLKRNAIAEYGEKIGDTFFEPTSWDWRWPKGTRFQLVGVTGAPLKEIIKEVRSSDSRFVGESNLKLATNVLVVGAVELTKHMMSPWGYTSHPTVTPHDYVPNKMMNLIEKRTKSIRLMCDEVTWRAGLRPETVSASEAGLTSTEQQQLQLLRLATTISAWEDTH